METTGLHHEVRVLISQADHLSRVAYAANRERDAEVFASLRTTLQRIDRMLGIGDAHAPIEGEVDVVYQRVRDFAARATAQTRAEMRELVAGAERMHGNVTPPRLIVQRAWAVRQLD